MVFHMKPNLQLCWQGWLFLKEAIIVKVKNNSGNFVLLNKEHFTTILPVMQLAAPLQILLSSQHLQLGL